MKIFTFIKNPPLALSLSGIVLFTVYTLLFNYFNREQYVLHVTTTDITQLEQAWASRMNRAPTTEERQALIDNFIEDQVLYRTALEMGLDQNDQVIHGRMIQKLKFLGNDLIRPPQPSEQDLITFYEERKESYMPEETITITQIFFNPDQREDATLEDADKALQILRASPTFDGDISGYGDSFMLQNYYPGRTTAEIRKLFGSGFAEEVFKLEPEEWHGPVLSGYGTHLVYVHSHQKSEILDFEIVREQVKTEWAEDMQQKLNKRYIEGLMARYEIIFEENL